MVPCLDYAIDIDEIHSQAEIALLLQHDLHQTSREWIVCLVDALSHRPLFESWSDS